MNAHLSTPLADLLPHKPPMVLLDGIQRYDSDSIACNSRSHLDPHNPLRQNALLSVFAGVEYAAQAMALHARLTADSASSVAPPRKGFLAVANKLQAHVRTLDEAQFPLTVTATRINGDQNSSLYGFTITADDRVLLEGQLIAVMAESETDPA
jgi:predicted hotdog family 3-hydroxylacyl-ACP dehydratase